MEQKINPTKILVIEVIETPVTKSGIILPDTAKQKSSIRAKIILTGKGSVDLEMIHEVGDTVLINPYAGSKFEWDGKEVKLVDQADVLLNMGKL